MSPDIVQALVKAIELKDLSTAAHTWRVVLYSRALAERANLSREFITRLTYAAALHDVGKIEIPDAILQKPAKLTPDEFKIIQQHAALGHQQLVRMGEEDQLVLDLVRHHHERIDGKGYPDGLAGSAVPEVARYFSVIDSFDAMTSIRPYRRELGPDAERCAIDELTAGIGTRYCAEAVGFFASLYHEGALDWILEYYNDNTEPTLVASDVVGRADKLIDLRPIQP